MVREGEWAGRLVAHVMGTGPALVLIGRHRNFMSEQGVLWSILWGNRVCTGEAAALRTVSSLPASIDHEVDTSGRRWPTSGSLHFHGMVRDPLLLTFREKP
jgi:hypothetical protein